MREVLIVKILWTNFRWNQLDTMIVVLSIAGIVMEKMKSGQVLPINPTLIRVMRVLRIARGKKKIRFQIREKLSF
jgi:uncharacterized membrane protein YqjE